jgi:hypothetical protein
LSCLKSCRAKNRKNTVFMKRLVSKKEKRLKSGFSGK